ncbi:putative exonuclease mut-7-like protein [Aphelenchoides fujianensis]|nr:putative exonuclease mut-7-like protein [Aphelenchoides fujianensis]
MQPAVVADWNDELQLTDEQRVHIFFLIIRLDFPPRIKPHSLLGAAGLSILTPTSQFGDLVKRATEEGQVAFWALRYAMLKFGSTFEDVSVIGQLLMIGRVSSQMIEEFLSDRSEEDRERARSVILQAEKWGTGEQLYFGAVYAVGRQPQLVLPFPRVRQQHVRFDDRTATRTAPQQSDQHAVGFSRPEGLLRKMLRQAGVDDGAALRPFVFFTVLKQRPQLRSNVVTEFKRNGDHVSAGYWQNVVIDRKSMHFHAAILANKLNVPPAAVYNVPDIGMHEARPNFLSIPEGVDVFIVDKGSELKVIEHELAKVAKSDYPILGLDAGKVDALRRGAAVRPILQIAFKSTVFIVDLDSIEEDKNFCLSSFMDTLFSNPDVVKIGFHFSGRPPAASARKVPNALGLLILESKKNPQIDVSEFVNMERLEPKKEAAGPPDELSLEQHAGLELSLNTTQDSISLDDAPLGHSATIEVSCEPIDPDGDEEPPADQAGPSKTAEKQKAEEQAPKLKNFGLSALCEAILGLPLDKMEQCSDWARRPLRMNQIRYAALDSYSQLMIYDRCAEWARALGLNIQEITDAQERISTPLPLFFDRSKMKSAGDAKKKAAV